MSEDRGPTPIITPPDPMVLIRHCTAISSFTPDPDFPGHLVAWASSWMFMRYRSGLWGAVPISSPVTIPVGMGAKGKLGAAWLQQELRRLGEAMVMDLACLGITGGVKMKGVSRRRGGGVPGRNWYWRAVEELHYVSPARVEIGEEAWAPQSEPPVEIGRIVIARVAGKKVEALLMKKMKRI